ncbi:HD domain-containing protein [Zunongwangia sp. F363]|uniref:HD domain-containing protein n=1 Tax=Autumnicola tepida TaxID=3075595 RepID=A0ABU3CA31_9FLAO|nr:HD domain-containing protein [Zunongwangia sp. F363]MDT0643189.1 HD domain-containing protein [Zunongwangia sp. F363]
MNYLENGSLNRREKKKYILGLIQAEIQNSFSRILYGSGLKEKKHFRVQNISIPDSRIVFQALEEAESNYSERLLKHCYRTFYWSSGLGLVENLKFDPELLFISSILHDIALSENHNHICSQKCFALHGADYIHSFAIKNKLSGQEAEILKNAVLHHLNPSVDKEKIGPEAYLLAKGAVLDVAGHGYHKLPHPFIIDIHRTYPREGFKEEITHTMEHFDHVESSRAHILLKMGFVKKALNNKLDRKQMTLELL